MALIGLAVVFGDWLVNIAETMVVGRNGERLLYTLRVKIFAQLQRLGLDFYERELSGRIMTRMTTDVDALSTFLQTGLITMVSSLLTFVGVLVAMLVINVRLGLFVLAIVPFLVVATVVFRVKSSRAYTEARERVSVVNADLAENVAGLRVTQAFRREDTNRSRFAGRSLAYRASRLRAQRYIALYFPFVQTLSTVASTLVLVLAVGQVRSGALTAGALIAYLLYIDMVFSPIQQLSQVFDGYQQAAVGLQRIKDLMRLRTTTPEAASPVPVPAAGFEGRIELRDVHFSYGTGSELSGIAGRLRVVQSELSGSAPSGSEPASGSEAISGVSFTISPGETVALVGQTGAGKSTIVKLIARFYDVTSGAVLVDGVDVRSYDLTSFRHRLGVVPQEAYLFSGTVAEAIAYARPDALARRGDRGGAGRRRARDDHAAARRLRPRGGRAGPEPVGRTAAAHRAGPGRARRPRHPAARRGDRGTRPGVGGGRHRRHQAAHLVADHDRRRAPADHRGAGRPHRRPGSRAGRRDRHARGTAGPRRRLRRAVGRVRRRNGVRGVADTRSVELAGGTGPGGGRRRRWGIRRRS